MKNDVVPVQIRGILPANSGCALFVGNDEKVFVINVEPQMGAVIGMFLRQTPKERPLTHDLINRVFQGFGINVEQNLTRYVTAFARFGWDNGKTESFAYTEVDQTFAEGFGANGAWWHRKQDRAGVAFISNAIAKDHQNYLGAGGLGFLLGDGHLNDGRENILESYYTVHVWRGIYLAPGVQHIDSRTHTSLRPWTMTPLVSCRAILTGRTAGISSASSSASSDTTRVKREMTDWGDTWLSPIAT